MLFDCITYVNQRLSDFDEKNYTFYADTIAKYFDVIIQAQKYINWPPGSLLKTSVMEYVSYLQENFDDFGWIVIKGEVSSFKNTDENEKELQEQGLKTIKEQGLKKFFSLFENATGKHSPFTSGIVKTLAEFDKFIQAIANPQCDVSNSKIECLLPALRDDDLPTIISIVTADPGCINRTYPLNRIMDEIGFTPVMYAAKHCHKAPSITEGLFGRMKSKKEIVAHIINKITQPDSPIHNYNVLTIAARYGDSKIFSALLNYVSTSKAFFTRAMIEKILKALCSSYLADEDANKNYRQLLKIFGVGDNTLDDSEITSFLTVINTSIFSQNQNLLQKIVAFHQIVSDLKPVNDPIHFRYAHMSFLQTIGYHQYLQSARGGLGLDGDEKETQGRAQRRKLI